MYTAKRDIMMQGLQAAGLKAVMPKGTYFVMADFSEIFDGTAMEFSRYLIEQIGVAGIPPGSFYCDAHRHIGDKHLRFSFCKSDDILREAGERLAKLKR
jgi:N-succinyldiaminopimelate aminotransferase